MTQKFQREGFATVCNTVADYKGSGYTTTKTIQLQCVVVEDFNTKLKIVSTDTIPEFPKTILTEVGEMEYQSMLVMLPIWPQPKTSIGIIEVELDIPDRWVVLNNGEFLYNSHGKYAPNLTYICKEPQIVWNRMEPKNLNLDKGNFRYVIGDYFVSKKGSNCFRVKSNGKHMLIMDDWGGCFNRYRGNTLPEKGSLYYRRAQSNGGGSGNDYAIYPKNWMNTISLDDI